MSEAFISYFSSGNLLKEILLKYGKSYKHKDVNLSHCLFNNSIENNPRSNNRGMTNNPWDSSFGVEQ